MNKHSFRTLGEALALALIFALCFAFAYIATGKLAQHEWPNETREPAPVRKLDL